MFINGATSVQGFVRERLRAEDTSESSAKVLWHPPRASAAPYSRRASGMRDMDDTKRKDCSAVFEVWKRKLPRLSGRYSQEITGYLASALTVRSTRYN